MKVGKYELTQRDVVVSIIFGVAGISAFFLIFVLTPNIVVEGVKILPEDFFPNVTNACINTSSFFLAAIFAIYVIIFTLDNTVPGKFLYLKIIPIREIIDGVFALICSYFAATLPFAILLLGVSLELTILTLAEIYFLINVVIPLTKTRNKAKPINLAATNENE